VRRDIARAEHPEISGV